MWFPKILHNYTIKWKWKWCLFTDPINWSIRLMAFLLQTQRSLYCLYFFFNNYFSSYGYREKFYFTHLEGLKVMGILFFLPCLYLFLVNTILFWINTLQVGIQIRKLKRKKQPTGTYLVSRAINKVSNLITAPSPNFHLLPLVFIGYITCTCLL